jgi:hypothetical protein
LNLSLIKKRSKKIIPVAIGIANNPQNSSS